MLEIVDLAQKYPRFTLGPISLQIAEKSAVGLIGVNGAGKTTLFNALSGISQTDTGSILINGATMSRLDRLRKVAFLQNRDIYYRSLTLKRHLTLLREFYGTWSDAMSHKLAERFQIDLDRRAGESSTGTLRKFALLAALARGANVLLLDEPWSSLDPPSRSELSIAIKTTRDENNAIFVISSHDLAEFAGVADRVVMLSEGTITSDETREEVSSGGDSLGYLAAKFARPDVG